MSRLSFHSLYRADTSSDSELLARFAGDRDEIAFASLVARHGPLVLGVARRLLGDPHAAEDVFQGTFLALARRAGSLRQPRALPAWLHRTAVRAAMKARRRRPAAPLTVDPPGRPGGDPLEAVSARELLAAVDRELAALPEQLRAPLVLCGLQGRPLDEAAAALGVTVSAIKGRLERARAELARRLARRGLPAAAGALPLLDRQPAVADALRSTVVRAAVAGVGPVGALSAAAWLAAAWKGPGRWAAVLTAALLLGVLAALGPTTEPPAPPKGQPAEAPAVEKATELMPAGAFRRFGTARFRTGTVPLALADNGKTVVTVSPAGVVRHFEAESGRLRKELRLPLPETTLLMQRLIRLSRDGSVAVLQVFHADGRGHETIAWSTADGRMLWNRANRAETVVDVDLSADGRRLAALVFDGAAKGKTSVHLADLPAGRVREIKDVGSADTVRLAPNGGRVLVGSAPKDSSATWKCFEAETGKKVWDGLNAGRVLSFSADSSLAFVDKGVEPNGLLILDAATGKPAEGVQPPEGRTYEPWPPVSSPRDPLLLVRFPNADRTALWDYRAGRAVADVALQPVGSQERFQLAAFSPDGRFLYSTVGQLQRWDAATGRSAYPDTEKEGHTRPVTGVKFSPDGRELFSIGMDWRYFRWDARTGKPLGSGRADPGGIIGRVGGQQAVVRIGQRQVVFERLADPAHVRPEAGGDITPTGGFVEYVAAAAPTADGRAVLMLTDNGLKKDRRLTLTVTQTDPVKQLSARTLPWTVNVPRHPFSPCGRWAVVDGKVIHVESGQTAWQPAADIPGGQQGLPLWNLRPVWFSPDGRFLAGSLATPRPPKPGMEYLAVWEVASGQAFAPLLLRYEDQLALSPGGRTAVRTGLHGVAVHDLSSGTALVLPPRDVTSAYTYTRSQTVVFAPDGRSFATGHDDGSILQWGVPDNDAVAPPAGGADDRWATLADPALAKARPVVEYLVRHPGDAVALLRAKFPPAKSLEAGEVARLVLDLDAGSFAARQAASKKLKEIGGAAEPALRKALEGTPSAELRKRAEALLEAMGPEWRLPLQGDLLRGVRAIEILERVGTPEAKELLAGWRAQNRFPRLASEAGRALDRLP